MCPVLRNNISTVVLNSPGGVKLHQPQTVTLQNLPVEVRRIELNHVVTGRVESVDREDRQGARQHTWKHKQRLSVDHKHSALKWTEHGADKTTFYMLGRIYASSRKRNLNAVQEPMTCMTLGSYAHLIMHLVSGLSMFNHKHSRMYSCPVVQKKTWLLYLHIIWKRAHRHQPNSSVAVLFFLQKMVAAFKSQICFLHAPTRWAFTRTPLHNIWTAAQSFWNGSNDQDLHLP